MKWKALLSVLVTITAVHAAPTPFFNHIVKAVTGDVGRTALKIGANVVAGPVAVNAVDLIPKA
jgi:hypothetical protein